MPNLGLGQPAWTQIGRELFGLYGKPVKDLRELRRKFDDALARVQVRDNGGAASLLSGWVITGAKYGTNTNEDGALFPRVTKDAVATTIAAGSNGVNVSTFAGAGTLHAASTTGFPTSGSVTVTTGSGARVVTYTGIAGNDFTGCTVVTGAGVMATGGAIATCTVSLYTATGASGLVAQGIGAYPSTVTLSASSSSGLGATVIVGALSGSEAVDTHYLTVFNDYIVNARQILDGTQPEHGAMLADYRTMLVASRDALIGLIDAIQVELVDVLTARVRRSIGSGQTTLLNKGTTELDGVVTTDYLGNLEDLRADMAAELSPAAQTVLKNTLAAAAAAFAVTNAGLATLAGPTLSEFAYAGAITGVCVDDTFGSEQFAISQLVSGTNAVTEAENNLTIDRAFVDPALGISAMLLSRLVTLSYGGTGGVNDFGSASNWTLTGLSSSNVDSNQKLYSKVIVGVIDPSKWIVQLYSSSDYATASLVSQSAEAAASATGVLLTAQNGSGLSGVVPIGASPTAAHTGTVACNRWLKKNSSNVADSFTVAVTQSTVGEIQDIWRVLLGYYLNSASSNPTLPDGLLSAGTFPPFVVRDV